MIGEDADLNEELQILNRTVRWSSRAWVEADPRHLKEVLSALGLEGASPAPTPGGAPRGRPQMRVTKAAPRLNYLSQDRPDATFATMKLCSVMSRPDAQDLKNMKRVFRFLIGRPRVG